VTGGPLIHARPRRMVCYDTTYVDSPRRQRYERACFASSRSPVMRHSIGMRRPSDSQAGRWPTFLMVERVSKSFGPIEVLRDVSLVIETGKVHAVIGENGAGKSTLMKIIGGHLQPSSGRLLIDGTELRFASSSAAEAAGIVLIHQEILLADDLTIAGNIFLGRELRHGPFTNDERMRGEARAKLAQLGSNLDPDAKVRGLSVANRQLVQIARALLVQHRLIIFDEPTAALTPVDARMLFGVIARLTSEGAGVLYISHRLHEVKAVADDVTVLRDGLLVGTYKAGDLEPFDMARLMVGREMSKLYPARAPFPKQGIALEATDIRLNGSAAPQSFALRQGEILGFAGLIGAGRTELMEATLGLSSREAGVVSIDGERRVVGDIRAAMAAGVVYLSEDRKGKGVLLQQSLKNNLTLAALDRYKRGPLIDAAREEQALDRAISEFDIRVRRRNLRAGELSGGNQQKLLVAKMMQLSPRIVVFDEPTRGIDIGTKAEIYRFIAALAEQGKSVIVISSEMQELIGLCHRILVMREGRIVGELAAEEATEDKIVTLATGVAAVPSGARMPAQ
jgi:ribose transport system ATP-binding protein